MNAPPLLAALASTAAPLAWADAEGRLSWLNAAFAALGEPAPSVGDRLADWLGAEAWATLARRGDGAGVAVPHATPGQPHDWRLHAHAADDGSWVLTARRPPSARAVRADADALRAELDAVLTLAEIGVWRHEIARRHVRYDERFSAMVGVPHRPEGYTLDEARAMILPEDLPISLRSTEITLRDGQPSDMQLRYPRPDGSVRHLLSRRVLQRDEQQRPSHFIGVVIDITDTLEQRQQVLEGARRLEAAAAAAGIGLWSADSDWALPRWNALMPGLLGLPPGQTLALREWVHRCVHPQDQAPVLQQVRNWWRSHEGQAQVRFRVIRPSDGALRWLVLRGYASVAAGGLMRRAEGVLIDVTEHQHAADRLAQTLERLTLASRAVGLGTWESVTRDNRMHWDEQMFRLRGLDRPAGEVMPEESMQFLHPDDRGWVPIAQYEALRDARPWRLEFRVQWPDGTVRWLSSISVPIRDEHGEFRRRIGMNWDSTEAHGVAEAERERERAVAENQAKSRWMSRISHELRTPLNAVLGFTQLARRSPQAGAEQREAWLKLVEDASRDLLALVDQVLERSAAESGERPRPMPPSTPPPPTPATAGDAAPARVLYIEDNPVNAMLVRELLRTRPGVALQVAEDGGRGLAAAAAQAPDLILIDLHLPDMSGLSVARALRTNPATAAITCVALSANATEDDMQQAREAGFADYWTKPIDLGRFLHQLARVLGRPV